MQGNRGELQQTPSLPPPRQPALTLRSVLLPPVLPLPSGDESEKDEMFADDANASKRSRWTK